MEEKDRDKLVCVDDLRGMTGMKRYDTIKRVAEIDTTTQLV